jgi:hypothetical protein
MVSRAILNPSRAIFAGLIAVVGLVGIILKPSTDTRLTSADAQTKQYQVNKPFLPFTPKNNVATVADFTGNTAGRGNPLWGIPLASLTFTRDRPIFSSTRRAPPVSEKPIAIKVPMAERPPLALVGAIAGDKNDGIGIFLDKATKRVIRLKTGESHMGWTLRLVKGREATLQMQQKIAVFALPTPPEN